MSDTVRWVRISAVPGGEEPLWVRQAWLGIELPDRGETPSGTHIGLITGKKFRASPDDVVVSARIALKALRAKHPAAAKWFDDNTFWATTARFVLKRSEVTVIPSPSPPSTEILELFPPE